MVSFFKRSFRSDLGISPKGLSVELVIEGIFLFRPAPYNSSGHWSRFHRVHVQFASEKQRLGCRASACLRRVSSAHSNFVESARRKESFSRRRVPSHVP
jgi:hypothetical protein